jgi:hypothetical protein
MSTRAERAAFFLLPAFVLVVAFVGVCVIAGTAWPWTRIVHEDGVRTLLGTIFYFEHATRELLLDLTLALGVAGAVRYFFPPTLPTESGSAARWRKWLIVWAAVVLAVILVGTAVTEGAGAIGDNLAQLHTREGAPLSWGAHWRYHLIERFAEILLAFAVTGVIWILRGRPDARRFPRRSTLFLVALGVFAAGTIIFHPTLESFREPTFLGHAFRELFTHVLVTMPLALGVCFEMARRFSSIIDSRSIHSRSTESLWPIALAGALAIASGVFLLAGSVLTKAQAHGQKTGLAALLFPHFFEHTLGYLFVPTLAGALYLWPTSGSSLPTTRTK